VIALGIGSAVYTDELNNIASEPRDSNVILLEDFRSLTDVEQQLRNAICNGRYSLMISKKYII